jgi:hypothetical protein
MEPTKMMKVKFIIHLDEPKVDRNAKFDILSFWKGNEFWLSCSVTCWFFRFRIQKNESAYT